jgi:hypothetical protein
MQTISTVKDREIETIESQVSTEKTLSSQQFINKLEIYAQFTSIIGAFYEPTKSH